MVAAHAEDHRTSFDAKYLIVPGNTNDAGGSGSGSGSGNGRAARNAYGQSSRVGCRPARPLGLGPQQQPAFVIVSRPEPLTHCTLCSGPRHSANLCAQRAYHRVAALSSLFTPSTPLPQPTPCPNSTPIVPQQWGRTAAGRCRGVANASAMAAGLGQERRTGGRCHRSGQASAGQARHRRYCYQLRRRRWGPSCPTRMLIPHHHPPPAWRRGLPQPRPRQRRRAQRADHRASLRVAQSVGPRRTLNSLRPALCVKAHRQTVTVQPDERAAVLLAQISPKFQLKLNNQLLM